MKIYQPESLEILIKRGLVQIGEETVIEAGVELCHPKRSGEQLPVIIGNNCYIRSGTVIYSGVKIGDHTQTGHRVMIRENTTIGNHSVIGTGAVVEFATTIGNHVMIETQAYITAFVEIEDYVFVAPCVVTTNDKNMLWRREGANRFLKGPTLQWGCRIGGGSTLLPAVTIGREAVVGAGSVVTKDIPPHAVAFGNPARIVAQVSPDEQIML
jgi:acetyltransferase-like isoleucine patch superfamily enzyme